MKNLLVITVFCIFTSSLFSQNYQISFAAQGASSNVDSVMIENLTQNTFLKMSGGDILNLVGTNDIDDNSYFIHQDLTIYPNPFNDYCNINFNSPISGIASIIVYDMVGKVVFSKSEYIEKGEIYFQLFGIGSGAYLIQISSDNYSYFGKLVSQIVNQKVSSNIELKNFQKQSFSERNFNELKLENNSKMSTVNMTYNTGDRLKFTGISGTNGAYKTVYILIPTSSQIITFDFNSCTDLDGNNYSTVSIGNQIWMAENLKYLPSVVGSAIGSNTEPYYYVYGYQGTNIVEAKSAANYNTYGVLYNWPSAMAGSSSSNLNPSGVQGVCPSGWHLPSNAEWIELFDYCGPLNTLGGKLKETGYIYWNSPNTGATNEFGFSILGAGDRNTNLIFQSINKLSAFITSTAYNDTQFWFIRVGHNYSELVNIYYDKEMAMSVRCIKN